MEDGKKDAQGRVKVFGKPAGTCHEFWVKLKETGMNPRQFAELTGMSRQTAYAWAKRGDHENCPPGIAWAFLLLFLGTTIRMDEKKAQEYAWECLAPINDDFMPVEKIRKVVGNVSRALITVACHAKG
ncbi:hypothetical protein LJC24_02105 [Desulfococcaceae bacterium OttesenSCG-928-F15]|nr:hypothetical protein [Desulfococcaceae bacterium OttesenSCG-928-F15]